MISHFRDKVLLPEQEFAALLQRHAELRALTGLLRERIRDERNLLTCALHQLAVERASKDPQAFIHAWMREQRRKAR